MLLDRLDRFAFGEFSSGEALALKTRHVRLIELAQSALDRAGADPNLPLELLALELREALDALGGVLGQVTPDDVLGKVFSSFCIGK
jgi:tRNA modification GTPase